MDENKIGHSESWFDLTSRRSRVGWQGRRDEGRGKFVSGNVGQRTWKTHTRGPQTKSLKENTPKWLNFV